MTFSSLEFVIVALAAGIAALLVRPYVPAWIQYVVGVMIALYAVLHALDEGPSVENVGAAVFFALLAAHAWWTELRGKRRGSGREDGKPGPRTKEP